MNGNYIFIVLAIAALIALIAGLRSKYSAICAEMLLYLVMKFEAQLGDGTGEVKYSAVTEALHKQLPTVAQLVLTQKEIDKLIENAVDYMKVYQKAKRLENVNVLGRLE